MLRTLLDTLVARIVRSAQADRTMRDGGRFEAQSPDCADIATSGRLRPSDAGYATRYRLHPGYKRLAHG